MRADANLYRDGAVYPAPDAGMYFTATDLARLYQALLDGGILDGRRVLSAASIRMMTQVNTGDLNLPIAPGLGYGLGSTWYAMHRAPSDWLRLELSATPVPGRLTNSPSPNGT